MNRDMVGRELGLVLDEKGRSSRISRHLKSIMRIVPS
jgi:hypothetical protein